MKKKLLFNGELIFLFVQIASFRKISKFGENFPQKQGKIMRQKYFYLTALGPTFWTEIKRKRRDWWNERANEFQIWREA
jgi:hypothetical protein